jgi:hypothetical protein
VLAIRGIVRHDNSTGWLLSVGNLLHGSLLIAANVVIYGEICWIAFWCIRRTIGKERLFMVGLFGNILLWPFRMLLPHWAVEIHQIGALGLGVAVLAAFSLLLDYFNRAESNLSV